MDVEHIYGKYALINNPDLHGNCECNPGKELEIKELDNSAGKNYVKISIESDYTKCDVSDN